MFLHTSFLLQRGGYALPLPEGQRPWANILGGFAFVGIGILAIWRARQPGGEFYFGRGSTLRVTRDQPFLFLLATLFYSCLVAIGVVFVIVGIVGVYNWETR